MATILVDTVSHVGFLCFGVVQLKAKIKSHLFPSLMQLIDHQISLSLRLSLKDHIEGLVLITRTHPILIITKKQSKNKIYIKYAHIIFLIFVLNLIMLRKELIILLI